MKEVTTRCLRVPLGAGRGGSGATAVEVLLVRIEDDGQEGLGFTYSLDGGILACERALHDLLGPWLRGIGPQDWERVWFDLWGVISRLGRGVALSALSAMDIAVWDLRARGAGLPLYRLLGAQREAIPVYGSGRATHSMSDGELVEGALSYLEEGYTQLKLRAGLLGLERDVQRVRTVREAVGSAARILVDCNERLNLADALWLAPRLADLDVYWLEEPLPSDDIKGYTHLAAKSPVPIAAGEHLHGRFEFENYFSRRALAVAMPDIPITGGFSEALRIGTLAEVSGVAVSPHFLPELHVHFAAAVRPAISIEHFPLLDAVLGETLQIRNGMARPPERAGHGMVWDADAVEHFALSEVRRVDLVGTREWK